MQFRLILGIGVYIFTFSVYASQNNSLTDNQAKQNINQILPPQSARSIFSPEVEPAISQEKGPSQYGSPVNSYSIQCVYVETRRGRSGALIGGVESEDCL